MSRHSIALLNDAFPPIIDGVANALFNYAKHIEKSHGRAVVLTPQMPGTDDSVYDFRVVRYPSIDTRGLIGYMTGYPFSPEAATAIEDEKVELLHTHCPATSALLARSLAEAKGLPLVLTWHTKYDIDIANAIKSKLLREGAIQALMANVNACDEIWTVSEGAGENLRSLGYEGDYIVMPNGVDLPREKVGDELIARVTSGYDLPEGVPCFLFIGRLMWYKGLRIIRDALKELDGEGLDFRMVFVGGGGDEKDVRKYSSGLGLDKKVIFTGPEKERDRLRAWYSRAGLFLFPSTFDTNGLVVREAAASDTASVIIAGSCAAEGVTDGRNGFLIEENAASLAAKLRELMDRPETVKKVGEGAGDELYISWADAVANAYERYEAVIDNYKRGLYGRHDPLKGSWMQSQGELMQIIGDIDTARKDLDSNLRSARNKAIVDVITAGYETRESIKDLRKEAVSGLESLLDEVSQSFWDGRERSRKGRNGRNK